MTLHTFDTEHEGNEGEFEDGSDWSEVEGDEFKYNDISTQWKDMLDSGPDETTPDRPEFKAGGMASLVRISLIRFATSALLRNGYVREDEG
jgi:hypothetical protein